MQAELESLRQNSAYHTASQQERQNIKSGALKLIPARLLATLKPTEHGMRKKKVRIVGCGNHQSKAADLGQRLDTKQVDATSIRLLVRWAAGKNLDLGAIDIKTAFLNAALPADMAIAVRPPKILERMGLIEPDEFWVLDRALYGLRVSPRQWQSLRDDALRDMAWTVGGTQRRLIQSSLDPALWCIVDPTSFDGPLPEKIDLMNAAILGLLGTYVDDILGAAERAELEAFFAEVRKLWKATDPVYLAPFSGEEITFVGMQVFADKAGFFMHQRPFAEEVLRQWHMESCRTADTPGDKADTEFAKSKHRTGGATSLNDCAVRDDSVDPQAVVQAQRLAGSFQWLASRSRPDISYTVSRMASKCTTEPEWALATGMRLLRYMRKTADLGIMCTPFGDSSSQEENQSSELVTYTDASWGPDGGEASHLGVIVFWAGAAVAWRSSRAALVATSSCECELQAAGVGLTLGSGVQALLESVGVSVKHELAIDNTAALAILDGRTTWRTRHLAMRALALRDAIRFDLVVVYYVQTGEQLADALTKHTTADVYQRLMHR